MAIPWRRPAPEYSQHRGGWYYYPISDPQYTHLFTIIVILAAQRSYLLCRILLFVEVHFPKINDASHLPIQRNIKYPVDIVFRKLRQRVRYLFFFLIEVKHCIYKKRIHVRKTITSRRIGKTAHLWYLTLFWTVTAKTISWCLNSSKTNALHTNHCTYIFPFNWCCQLNMNAFNICTAWYRDSIAALCCMVERACCIVLHGGKSSLCIIVRTALTILNTNPLAFDSFFSKSCIYSNYLKIKVHYIS